MMDVPLSIQSMFQHGLDLFGKKEVVSRTPDGGTVRHTFSQIGERVHRLAEALHKLGVGRGDLRRASREDTHGNAAIQCEREADG